ncbi:MAG: zinc-dependent alcohol dehydrogenase family protein [Chlamydiota bacterium]
MRAMVLTSPKSPLRLLEVPTPKPKQHQVLVKVQACAVCRTDLHILDGDLHPPHLPLIPGHQIVGIVAEQGPSATRFKVGQRIGIPWLGKTCRQCRFCLSQRENLCERAQFTGYHLDGGYAELCVADENYCYHLPEIYSHVQVAPLLCGGLIGFRAFRMLENAQKIGFYGFGSAAHILAQIANYQQKHIYAFTRPNDKSAQELAKKLGAVWASSSEKAAPTLLDSAIIFASVGDLIPQALQSVDKGGSVICAGIHMSAVPSFPYQLIYGERTLRSVANLTREDGNHFFQLAAQCFIHTHVTTYPLEKANEALQNLKEGKVTGSAVLELA